MRRWGKRTGALAAALLFLAAVTLPYLGRTGEAVAADGDAELTETPPLMALTFDDGPSAATTPLLLDGLAQRGVKATFFLVGSMAADNHALVRRMAAEGHQIAIHTYDHSAQRGLTGLSEAQFRAQVDTTRDLLTAITGQEDFLFRPPYGFVDDSVRLWADSPIILWSVDTRDWEDMDAARVADHIVEHAADGAIVLLHDIFRSSVEGALAAVDELLERGCRFVTVDELFEVRGIDVLPGEVYRSVPPA